MAVTWSDVAAIAPELAAVPSGAQTAILATASRQVSASVWGDWYDDGVKYLAAHMGALSLRGGASGAVASEAVGSLAASYSQPQGVRGALSATSYGAEYQRMVRMLPGAVGGAVAT